MSALPKSTESNDATTPSTHVAEFDDQPREADDHASVRSADPAAFDAYPDGRDDRPERDDGGPEAGGRDPDDRNHHPDAGDGDPGAADADPDANGGNPDAANDALRQAPPSRTATAALIEPSGWAEMPPGPQAHFAVIGTDIQSITIKTTAVAKKTTDRKPKAPPTPPGGAEGGGDGVAPPTTSPQGDDAPSGPEPRKPRIEFTIPAGLEDDFRAAADIVRDQLIRDPKGRHELVRAVSCVADKPKWRSIAAEASDIKNEEGKVEETCAALLAFASEGHDNAIDRIAHFASRLRKDPAGVVKWYDVAFDACLLTLGNHVLWRGGFIQRLLKRAFPKLNWKEAAERRATRDKQAAAKAAKAAG